MGQRSGKSHCPGVKSSKGTQSNLIETALPGRISTERIGYVIFSLVTNPLSAQYKKTAGSIHHATELACIAHMRTNNGAPTMWPTANMLK